LGEQKTPSEVADLIVRFIENRSFYPQEWNDFIECCHPDPAVEQVRKMCHDLDPLVNCPRAQDQNALKELRSIVERLKQAPMKTGV